MKFGIIIADLKLLYDYFQPSRSDTMCSNTFHVQCRAAFWQLFQLLVLKIANC